MPIRRLPRLRALALAGFALLGLLAGPGCSSWSKSFPVLFKVSNDLETPKRVDIVWVVARTPELAQKAREELEKYRGEDGMLRFYSGGRSAGRELVGGQVDKFRLHRFWLEDQPPNLEGTPLSVHPEPGQPSGHRYWGPYEGDTRPAGAQFGYLFVLYGKGKLESPTSLPRLVYPFSDPAYPDYEGENPGGVSVLLEKESVKVIPFPEEEPVVVEAARQKNAAPPPAETPPEEPAEKTEAEKEKTEKAEKKD